MANPEMSSAPEHTIGAVPPQASGTEDLGAAVPDGVTAGSDGSAFSEPGSPDSRPRSTPSQTFESSELSGRRLPLVARVLLADLGVAIVALIALTVIEVQRLGEPSMSLRRHAYAEDLVVLFVVAAVFGAVTFLLFRTGNRKAALVQAVVTALVLGVAVTSAATGSPKPIPPATQDQ
jgi:hypothetical protein